MDSLYHYLPKQEYSWNLVIASNKLYSKLSRRGIPDNIPKAMTQLLCQIAPKDSVFHFEQTQTWKVAKNVLRCWQVQNCTRLIGMHWNESIGAKWHLFLCKYASIETAPDVLTSAHTHRQLKPGTVFSVNISGVRATPSDNKVCVGVRVKEGQSDIERSAATPSSTKT